MTNRMKEVLASGRVPLITGAAKGLGAAVARRLADKGLRLVLPDADASVLAEFASTLPTEQLTIVGDVADYETLKLLRDEVYRQFGVGALLINKAGIKRGQAPGPSRSVETAAESELLIDIV